MDLPILSFTQYDLVFNVLSFTVACMFASAAFFIAARNSIGERYRLAVTIAALAVGIAGYHYVMIFYNWVASYDLSGMVYVPNGHRFNDAYRYVDWILTVPLLMVELVAVLRRVDAGAAATVEPASAAAMRPTNARQTNAPHVTDT